MNMFKIMSIIQNISAEGSNANTVQDIKHITIQILNEEFNCGYDRAEITVLNLIEKLANYAEEKEII